MKCEQCGNSLDGQDRVEIDGKPYCASAGRKHELEQSGTEHMSIEAGGRTLLVNFESPR